MQNLDTPKFVYVGPCWATKSSHDHQNNIEPVNLADRWGIEHVNLSRDGHSVLESIGRIKYSNHHELPIIWVYNEPIADLSRITKLSKSEFIQRPDWKDIWYECNSYCLKAISDLNRPVLLIGAYSDIVDCNYKNITIAHPSWQKWMAEMAGIDMTNNRINITMYEGGSYSFSHCWGADLVKGFMTEGIRIDDGLYKSMTDLYSFWRILNSAGYLYNINPTGMSTLKFADFLLPKVNIFLQENK